MDALATAAPSLSLAELATLGRGGFRCVEDLRCRGEWLSAPKVAAELRDSNITHVAALLAKVVRDVEDEAELDGDSPAGRAIVTFCKSIDTLLGGGAVRRCVLEVCGAPGTGKTQLAMQLAVDCSIPRDFGGAEGGCIYIDADGSFLAERCARIAEALVSHIKRMARKRGPNDPCKSQAAGHFCVESVLANIKVYRPQDELELLAILDLIEDEVADNVVLLIVDSCASHFRGCVATEHRPRMLARLALLIATLARRRQFAVVLTNQLTTRSDAVEVPALGDYWSHLPDTRLLLTRDPLNPRHRNADLLKSPSHPPSRAGFLVDERGVRDYTSVR